jgi:BlaI family transcriptional regulator, penicillinase repressor
MKDNQDIHRLTQAEEQLMLRLWKLGKGTVTEVMALYPDPKPAYNTLSTVIRILQKKKFVRYKPKGRGHVYYPRVEKEDYKKLLVNHLLAHYFENRPEEAMSYFNKQKRLDDLL